MRRGGWGYIAETTITTTMSLTRLPCPECDGQESVTRGHATTKHDRMWGERERKEEKKKKKKSERKKKRK
jgi:hypothetical protein